VGKKGQGKDAKASSTTASRFAPPLSKTFPPPDDSSQASDADTTATAVSSQPAADQASSSAAAEAPDSAPEGARFAMKRPLPAGNIQLCSLVC